MAGRWFLALAMIATTPALGSPRSDPTTGRAVFTGATSSSATSIALNPAAIGQGKTNEMYLAFAAVLEQFSVDRKLIDAGTDTLVSGPEVDDARFGAGGMLAFVWHPGERGTLGLELRLPPPELFPSDRALRYHGSRSKQRNYVATIGTSLKIASFYFGASLSHDVRRLQLRYSRDVGIGEDCDGAPCGFENPAAEEQYDIDVRSKLVSTENLNVNLGILVRIYRDVWLGLAYHNTPGFGIQSELDGTMDVTRAPRDGGGELRGASSVYVSYPASVDGELRARVLPEIDLQVGGRWEDLSRMQAYDVRAYGSAFRGESIPEWTVRPRGFRDSFALWAGIEQHEAGKWYRLGGRVGLETGSIATERTAPGAMSPTSFTLDAGAQLRWVKVAPSWILQISYGAQLFRPVDVTASDYDPRFGLECEASGFDYETRACAQVRNGYAIPTAAGDYTRIQHAIRIGLRYVLD